MPSLLPATLQGSQLPRIESRPAAAGSHGPRVLAFLGACGLTLDEWQALSISALHDYRADGTWAATEFGELVARQNGKGEILVGYGLSRLFLFPRADNRRRTILYTAHEVKTAIDGFQRLAGVVEASPFLMKRVKSIDTANGKEGIVLHPRPGQQMGDRIRFIARTKKSGRGFTADDLVVDEAQELGLQSWNALSYTQSQVRNRQVLFTGTVPEDGVNESEVWEGLRDRGRSGSGARTGWMEWTPEGSEDPDKADRINVASAEATAASNPSLGIRMPIDAVEDQLTRALTTDPDGYRRERLSIWPNRKPVAEIVLNDLDLDVWRRVAGDYPVSGEGSVIAIALGRGGGFATVSAACRVDEDHIAVEHKRTEKQTRWVAQYVKDLKAELNDALVVLDSKNAAPIITALQTAGVKFLEMNLSEIAEAHSTFVEWSNEGLVLHRDQPEVTESLRLATTRAIGKAGFTWEPSDPKKPVSHAQSVTWAMWGVLKAEARPKKKPAVVRGYA